MWQDLVSSGLIQHPSVSGRSTAVVKPQRLLLGVSLLFVVVKVSAVILPLLSCLLLKSFANSLTH